MWAAHRIYFKQFQFQPQTSFVSCTKINNIRCPHPSLFTVQQNFALKVIIWLKMKWMFDISCLHWNDPPIIWEWNQESHPQYKDWIMLFANIKWSILCEKQIYAKLWMHCKGVFLMLRLMTLLCRWCTNIIEQRAKTDLKSLEGVYRLSGQTSQIKLLKLGFDAGRTPSHCQATNIHSVGSLLKVMFSFFIQLSTAWHLNINQILCHDHRWGNNVVTMFQLYFRELPQPLLTYSLYSSFVRAVKCDNSANRSQLVRQTIQRLPQQHHRWAVKYTFVPL